MSATNINENLFKSASKLSDVKEKFKWYSLQIPELSELQPRVGHALVSLAPGKVMIIGGGNHQGAMNEILTIDLEPVTDSAERVTPHPASQHFPPRYEFACAKDDTLNCAWIFGGANTESTFNNIVKITEDTVDLLKCSSDASTDTVPCSRTQGNNSSFIEYQGKSCLAVFAGGLQGEQPVQDRDLYIFDISDKKWEKINVHLDDKSESGLPFGCQPPLIQGHAVIAIGSKIFVHGGINATTLYDGFHWIDFKKQNDDSTYSWIDSSVTALMSSEKPSGRAAHGIARIPDVKKELSLFYLFGGIGEKGALNDLWSFNVESMCWTQVLKNHGKDSMGYYPVPRLDFAMCAIGLPNGVTSENATSSPVYLMIHGGMSREGEIFNDAWIMQVE